MAAQHRHQDRIGTCIFQGTGVTTYLENKGKPEATLKPPGTTKLYEQRQDEISLD